MLAASWATIACLLASGGSQPAAAQGYTVPTPKISVLSPSGIRFEIAEPNAGVSLIAYRYSINVAVPGTQPGRWNYDTAPQDGYFVHENQLVTVNNGDTVYYWVNAIFNGLEYHLLNKQWTYRVSTSPLPPRPSSATTITVPSTPSLSDTGSATASTSSTTSLGTSDTWSTTVAPVSAAAPTAGVTEGLSTRDAIILGVALGAAVVLAAILSVILVSRSRRNSRRPPSDNSNPPVDEPPEASPARPLSDDQSNLYEYVDEAYRRGFARRSLGESAWPETALPLRAQALTGPRAGSRPPHPLPQNAGSLSTTPATDNYYIQLIK